jgi:hypothetical protein
MLAFAVALAAALVTNPASARSAQSGYAVWIAITGPTVVAPGGTLSFSGICGPSGSTTEAHVQANRTIGPGTTPVNFSVVIPVTNGSGWFSGSITVPGAASSGAYDLGVLCIAHGDMAFGSTHFRSAFTIDGAPVLTTTTSTPPIPLTQAPLRAQPHVVEAPPAVARVGTARLTG